MGHDVSVFIGRAYASFILGGNLFRHNTNFEQEAGFDIFKAGGFRQKKGEPDMQPHIKILAARKLVGKRLTMTFANNQTFKLWKSFMPGKNEIGNTLTTDLFSLQVYPDSFDFTFSNLNAEFEKWAAVEVANFDTVPDEMETFILPGGLYAVFDYKGLSTDIKIFQYIFETWLPSSTIYSLDTRPHFEILGANYKNNDPNSEEEIWIPIKPKE